MNGPPLVLFAVIDPILFKVAGLLIVFVLYILGQLGARLQQQRPPLAGAPRPAPPDAQPLQSEIEAFLERASRGTGEPRPVLATVVAEPAAAKRLSQAAARKAAEDNAEEPVGDEVVKHVEKFLDSGEFSRRTSQLGGEVTKADAQVEQRLKQTFVHDVGRLAKKPGETAMAPAVEEPVEAVVPALDFAALLANPVSFRQAILASEILRRPEDRWA